MSPRSPTHRYGSGAVIGIRDSMPDVHRRLALTGESSQIDQLPQYPSIDGPVAGALGSDATTRDFTRPILISSWFGILLTFWWNDIDISDGRPQKV